MGSFRPEPVVPISTHERLLLSKPADTGSGDTPIDRGLRGAAEVEGGI